MNTYPSYKDSDVDWIGKIPSNWDVKRIDHFFTERKDKVDDITYPPLSVTMNGIKDQLEGVAKSDDSSNRKLVLRNDFVINSRSDRKGSSGISFRDGSVSLINTVLEPKNIKPNYVNYLLKSYYFIEEYFRFGKGIHFDLWSTNYSLMKNIKIPVLSIEEQQQISDYLDYKTSKIDTLIEKTEQKIELLIEQRTSLINTTVTKGLNPIAEMKDSGVEWIGEIPKNWIVSRLDYLTTLNGRVGWKALKADEYVEDGYIFLSTPNIKERNIDFDKVNYITKERYLESPEIMLNVGDVLLVKDGSTLGITNFVKELPRESTVNSSIGVVRVKSNNLLPEYLFWFFSGDYIQNIIQRIRGGMGVPHLFQADIKKFLILLPPLQEQQKIVDYLDKDTTKIDKLIDIESKRIDLLKEYRQSLISDVVTGKVDVRDGVLV